MTFKPQLIVEIFNGGKTVTRRKAASHYKAGDVVAIQPGMGRPSMGKLRILSVTEGTLGEVDDAEAKLEGFPGIREFIDFWEAEFGKFDPARPVKRIEFEVIEQTYKLCGCCDGAGVQEVARG
jgi:hypothetical protein